MIPLFYSDRRRSPLRGHRHWTGSSNDPLDKPCNHDRAYYRHGVNQRVSDTILLGHHLQVTALEMSHYSQGPPVSRLCSLPEAQRLPLRQDVERRGVQGLLFGVRLHHLKHAPQRIPRVLVPASATQPD